jgi:hypothetical protein
MTTAEATAAGKLLLRRQGGGSSDLDRFAALAGNLEHAAAAIARLDTVLTGHPLAAAWGWRSRLDAVRRQAAADGRLIDPWHLAAVVEGVRFRMDGAMSIIDRGAIFAAARHACALWRWFTWPDAEQTHAIEQAAATLAASQSPSPLLGAAKAVRVWLDQGSERPPLRAALARHWQGCGLMHIAAPLLTGAAAFRADAPRPVEAWTGAFLAALAEEAEAGFSLLRRLEREWFAARAAIQDRRRDSHAAAAVDIMAAAPVVSATSLAAGLGIAVKNATALLDAFVARGIAIEVTHRSKRRLFGLKHLAPLRAEARPPHGARGTGVLARRGRAGAAAEDMPPAAESAAGGDAQPSRHQSLVPTPLERKEFEFSDLDDWMREADLVIQRSQAILDWIAEERPTGHRGDTTLRRIT